MTCGGRRWTRSPGRHTSGIFCDWPLCIHVLTLCQHCQWNEQAIQCRTLTEHQAASVPSIVAVVPSDVLRGVGEVVSYGRDDADSYPRAVAYPEEGRCTSQPVCWISSHVNALAMAAIITIATVPPSVKIQSGAPTRQGDTMGRGLACSSRPGYAVTVSETSKRKDHGSRLREVTCWES